MIWKFVSLENFMALSHLTESYQITNNFGAFPLFDDKLAKKIEEPVFGVRCSVFGVREPSRSSRTPNLRTPNLRTPNLGKVNET